MKTVMAIFAHPDDEEAMGGTLMKLVEDGHTVVLVCTTRGEVGEIADPSLATPETLGQVREQELLNAARVLGIHHVELLDFRDSGMDGTDENNDPRAFIQADPTEAKYRLMNHIRHYQPDVIFTFEPYGWYGHPDHKMTSKWVTELYPDISNPTAYPEIQGAYEPDYLYHSVIKFSDFKSVFERAIAEGVIAPEVIEGFGEPDMERIDSENNITHAIDVAKHFEMVRAAREAHKTQNNPDSPFQRIPDDWWKDINSNEYFIQVYPQPDITLTKTNATTLF